MKGYHLFSLCTLNLLSTLQSPPYSWECCAIKSTTSVLELPEGIFLLSSGLSLVHTIFESYQRICQW